MEKMIAGEMDIPVKKEKPKPKPKAKKGKSASKKKKKPKSDTGGQLQLPLGKKSESEKIEDVENTVSDIEKELSGLEDPEVSISKGVETEAVRRFKKDFVKSSARFGKGAGRGVGEINPPRLFKKYPASPPIAAKRSIKKLESLAKEAEISLEGVDLTPNFQDEFDVEGIIIDIARKIVEI